MVRSFHGIQLKKKFGQHFLRDMRIIDYIINAVDITNANVFEIGCGDGVLTKAILQKSVSRLWVFEIDHEWATHVRKQISDSRLTMYEEDILQLDFDRLKPYSPWILLSNLPYQITFPILYKLVDHRDILREAVVMIQEEVAQKLVQTRGRGYGFPSLFFQHYFEIKLLIKIPPQAFEPAPKVYSRLIHITPRAKLEIIPDEEQFWPFVKVCFKQPRRTLRNNLMQSHYAWEKLPESTLALRAQQLNMQNLLNIWKLGLIQ